MQRIRSDAERLAVAESKIEGHAEDIKEMNDTLKSIFESVSKIEKQMSRDRGFFAGMSLAYSSIGVLIGAGIEYMLHK